MIENALLSGAENLFTSTNRVEAAASKISAREEAATQPN
jgi:hypothetical protein